MASYETISQIDNALLKALTEVMEGQVKDDAREAIMLATNSNVYNAYSPIYNNRRWLEGGLADPETYNWNYDAGEQELTVKVATEWQNKGFRFTTGMGTGGNDLADVIEQNGMYNAPPRPFIKQAETNFRNKKSEIDSKMEAYLNTHV